MSCAVSLSVRSTVPGRIAPCRSGWEAALRMFGRRPSAPRPLTG
jgi:hypothetical protein